MSLFSLTFISNIKIFGDLLAYWTKKSLNEIEIGASTALRYSDSPKDDLSNVRVRIGQKKEEKELKVFPINDKILDGLRI